MKYYFKKCTEAEPEPQHGELWIVVITGVSLCPDTQVHRGSISASTKKARLKCMG